MTFESRPQDQHIRRLCNAANVLLRRRRRLREGDSGPNGGCEVRGGGERDFENLDVVGLQVGQLGGVGGDVTQLSGDVCVCRVRNALLQ